MNKQKKTEAQYPHVQGIRRHLLFEVLDLCNLLEMLLYNIHRNRKEYKGQGTQDNHHNFHTDHEPRSV